MNKEEFLKYMESLYDGMKKELSSDNIKKMIIDHFNCINMTQKRIYDSLVLEKSKTGRNRFS